MDILNITVMSDGTLEMKTGEISAGNHMSADTLLVEMEKLMGGKMIFQKDPDAQAHAHMHKHGVQHAHRH